MNRYIFFLCAALLCFASFEGTAQAAEAALNETELNSYYSALRQQVQKQDKLVQGMKQSLRDRKTIFSQAQRAQMEHAIVMLDVKRTLYANFYGTESVKQSPAVRKMLLQVLSQSDISTADLAALQNLVRQEKQRLKLQ